MDGAPFIILQTARRVLVETTEMPAANIRFLDLLPVGRYEDGKVT